MSEQAMRATNRIFEEEVVGRGDFGALSRVYTSTARILPPGTAMISGIDAIKGFWQAAAVALGVKAVRLVTVEATPVGDTIVEIGRAEVDTDQGKDALLLKYVVVWRQEGGTWRWDIDIWNAAA